MISDKLFKADIIVRCKKRALEEARKNQPGLVVWKDGSKLDQGQLAAAICWEDKFTGQWKRRSVFLGKNKEIVNANLWAILALDKANRTAIVRNILVIIFCDSQKALNAMRFPLLTRNTGFWEILYIKRLQSFKVTDITSCFAGSQVTPGF